MGYNLIEERWIPVRRSSGRVERIAPWELADPVDPPLRVESPRADFDAALTEFLIGLVQTVFTPNDSDEWADVYAAGVKPAELEKRMKTVRDAFELVGEGPRFMQDLEVHRDPKVEARPIEGLLIDRGMASDAALFAKEGGFEALGLPAAATAMLTLQSFAPSGGAGHRTSLRGGGPLSVTVEDVTLWRSIWCNVILQSDLDGLPGDASLAPASSRFPWMGPTRTSEKGRPSTFPQDIHPLQHFWGLPRRFRLVIDPTLVGDCALYGDRGVPIVREFSSRPHGTNFEGPFRHPLTPYIQGKAETPPNPRKGNSAGLPYRDWLLLTLGNDALLPPKVLEVFLRDERWRIASEARIAARGYAMDNMKPLRFVAATAPLLHVSPGALPVLRADAAGLVEASESVRRTLLQQVKAAWSDRPKDQAGDVEARVDAAFWSTTEAPFYGALRSIAALTSDTPEVRGGPKRTFLKAISDAATTLFDSLCPLNVDEGATSLARTVRARRDLVRFTHPESHSMLRSIGLAGAESSDEASKKPRRSSPRKKEKKS